MKSESLRTLDNLVHKLDYKISGSKGVLPGEIDRNIYEYGQPEEWQLYRRFRNQFSNIDLFSFNGNERVLLTKLLKRDRASLYQANRNLYYSQVDPLGNRLGSEESYQLLQKQEDLYRREGRLIEKLEQFMPFVERVAIVADKVKSGFKKMASKIKNEDMSQIVLSRRVSSAELGGEDAFVLYCVAKKFYCEEARCIQDKFEIKYPNADFGLFDIDLSEYAARMKLFEDTDNLKVSHETLKKLVLSENDEHGLH